MKYAIAFILGIVSYYEKEILSLFIYNNFEKTKSNKTIPKAILCGMVLIVIVLVTEKFL